MNVDIGPNLLAILGPVVTVAVLWIKSTIEARKASREREDATASIHTRIDTLTGAPSSTSPSPAPSSS